MEMGEAPTASRSSAKEEAIDSLVDFLGGTIGGTASVLVGQPLDTVKVKLQTFPHLYPNALRCFSLTLKQEGIRHGLYAGTIPSIAANVAENSVLFMCYGTIQRLIMGAVGKQRESDLSTLENGFAGFSAAFFSSLTLCPTELVKCRLQAMKQMSEMKNNDKVTLGNLRKDTVFSVCRNIYRAEGFRGFFHGLVPTFWREMPGYFFFFAVYDISRQSFVRLYGVSTKDDIGALGTVISGGLGGCALWTVIFPADVIKSRKQVMTMNPGPESTAVSKMGIFSLGAKIIRQEGFKALYRGLGPTLLRTFPATGVLVGSYEFTRRFVHSFV